MTVLMFVLNTLNIFKKNNTQFPEQSDHGPISSASQCGSGIVLT